MTRPPRALVALAALLFFTSCTGIHVRPVPEPAARAQTDVRGVVVGDTLSGQRIQFRRVDEVTWSDSSLVIVGVLEGAGDRGTVVTRSVELADIAAVLVNSVDAGKTSGIVAAAVLGAIVAATLALTGKTDDETVFRGDGGGPARGGGGGRR